jgi:hypothetical protein
MSGNRILFTLALSFCIGCAQQALAQSPAVPKYKGRELILPTGYETWVFVGSNLGLAYKEELKEMTPLEMTRADQALFHNIYINPEAYAHFRKTGEFPNPTILVMDMFEAADKQQNGALAKGVYDGDRRGIQVAVKNIGRPDPRITRPPWAYYIFTEQANPLKLKATAPAEPDNNCETCHKAHGLVDNVWVQFYPALRELLKTAK